MSTMLAQVAVRRSKYLDAAPAPVLSPHPGAGHRVITIQIVVFLLYSAIVSTLFALLVPGYLLWLWWGRRHGPRPPARAAETLPPLDVLVPVHDEAGIIAAKL